MKSFLSAILSIAAMGNGPHGSCREIPMEGNNYARPRIKADPPPHHKSLRQKYRAPEGSATQGRDPRHIHPRHVRARFQ